MLKPFVSTFSSVASELVWFAISRTFFSPSPAVSLLLEAGVFVFFGVFVAGFLALLAGGFFTAGLEVLALVALVALAFDALFTGFFGAAGAAFFALALVDGVFFLVIIREWKEYFVRRAWQALQHIEEKLLPTGQPELIQVPSANFLGIALRVHA